MRYRLPFAHHAKRRGWPVVPMDVSSDGLRYARQIGVQRAVQADTTRLPFADGVFDLALSLDVLVHLPKPAELDAAHELARVLRRGGLLAVRTSALDVLHSRHSDFAFERQRFTAAAADGSGGDIGNPRDPLYVCQFLSAADCASEVSPMGAAHTGARPQRRGAGSRMARSHPLSAARDRSGMDRIRAGFAVGTVAAADRGEAVSFRR